MDKLDAHVLLWLLIAFVAGTLWTPLVDLAAARWTVDNQEVMR